MSTKRLTSFLVALLLGATALSPQAYSGPLTAADLKRALDKKGEAAQIKAIDALTANADTVRNKEALIKVLLLAFQYEKFGKDDLRQRPTATLQWSCPRLDEHFLG